MTALHAPDPRKLAKVILILRVTGAFFLLAALLLFINLGGLANALGITDIGTRQVIGIVLGFVGLYDLAIMPIILSRAAKKAASNAGKTS